MFDAGKTRMIVLPYGEKNNDHMFSRVHLIPERIRTDRRTDRQTDGWTDRIAISISRVSVLTRDKNTIVQELSYRNRSRVSCVHNTLRASIGIT